MKKVIYILLAFTQIVASNLAYASIDAKSSRGRVVGRCESMGNFAQWRRLDLKGGNAQENAVKIRTERFAFRDLASLGRN